MKSGIQILEEIRNGFALEEEAFHRLKMETEEIVSNYPILQAISNLDILKQISHPKGHMMSRAGFISPKALFVSDRIKSLCRLNYRHPDSRIGPCGGIRKNYLACSPYAPKKTELLELFERSDLFCFYQADGLNDMTQQRLLHEILLKVESYLETLGLSIPMSFVAGPCRMCENCAGQFNEECYLPEKRRFSLESCGIDVDWAMAMMAKKQQDDTWKIKWLSDFGLGYRPEEFKSVVGFLIGIK